MIGTALRSVYDQSLLPSEIVIVDDGSTDDTEQRVIAASLNTLIPLVYLKQLGNRGPAAARNIGIKAASSEFVAFLDSDDSWHRKKLENQFAEMIASPDYPVSHTREIWYPRGKHLNQKKRHRPPHGKIFKHCLPLCCVGMSTVMARKNIFQELGYFDESLRCCEDYDFWLRVAACHSFLLVDQALTIKQGGRLDQVSIRYRQGMDKFRIQSLGKLLAEARIHGRQRDMVVAEMVKKCTIYGQGCMKHGKPLEGAHYLRLARTVMGPKTKMATVKHDGIC